MAPLFEKSKIQVATTDLLAEFEDEADLFDLIGMMFYLEEIFECPVDGVPKSALREELRESVLSRVVAV